MEWMGLLSFIIICCCYSYLGRIKRLERKVKRLEKKDKGENDMSKLIIGLVGETCKIKLEDDIFDECGKNTYEVLDADEEWIKVKEHGKKEEKIKLIRIDQIEKIELLKSEL